MARKLFPPAQLFLTKVGDVEVSTIRVDYDDGASRYETCAFWISGVRKGKQKNTGAFFTYNAARDCHTETVNKARLGELSPNRNPVFDND